MLTVALSQLVEAMTWMIINPIIDDFMALYDPGTLHITHTIKKLMY